MTLYLDTSNLVKQYVEEEDSDAVATRVEAASVLVTSVVAYAEARAAFARRRRERLITSTAHTRIVKQFDADWPSYLTYPVTEELARAAGALADRLAIRGCDSIHLASFERLVATADDEDVQFSSADRSLTAAAKKLG